MGHEATDRDNLRVHIWKSTATVCSSAMMKRILWTVQYSDMTLWSTSLSLTVKTSRQWNGSTHLHWQRH